MDREKIETQVIEQFGHQWTRLPDNEGYYGSTRLFEDLLGPLAKPADFRGKNIAEIGSGSGRIVNMLVASGAGKIAAIEPSEAMTPLKVNTRAAADRIVYLQQRGDCWSYPGLDFVLAFGVLHHIFDPIPTVRTALRNLAPGGRFIIWLYGKEGNELYLALVGPLRRLTTKLPDAVLAALSRLFLAPLNLYVFLCRFLPLPMRDYMLNHVGRLDHGSKLITVYDQLNPTWSKYYTRREAEALLADQGFVDVRSHHRHGYSWTVVGTKPVAPDEK